MIHCADDVCVTGMAWSTPLGETLDGVWRELLAGRTGLRVLPARHALRTSLAATVPTVPAEWPATERQVTLAAGTLAAAFASAGLDPADPGTRLVLGTSYGPCLDDQEPDEPDPGDQEPGEPAGGLDGWAVAAARRVGHPRRPVCVSTACSAGSDAIAVGAELVRAGVAERCLAGGVDVVTPAKRLGHSALGTMSRGPLLAFDQAHDGMVPGEGAAILVLESGRSAVRRAAPVRAVLRGAGSANDAAGLTAPDRSGESVVLAVRRCLAAGGLAAGEVAVLSAHATGTPINDEVESRSLAAVFGAGAPAPVVLATKGALGHSLGATGAIEAVSVLLALEHGAVPPVCGLARPLPGFPLPLPAGRPMPVVGVHGASLTIGFGGFNTCLLFEAVRPR